MYSLLDEGKYVVAERFIRILKNKIYKYMTSISKTVYIDKLDDIVNKYNKTYHRMYMYMPSMYIDFNKGDNKKGPKFKVDNNVRISKYKNIFAKGYAPNWFEETFVIKKVKNTVLRTNVISDLNGEEIVGTFYKKKGKQQIKNSVGLKK